jgi:CRISPR-associated exonuclease Cas4
MVSATQINYFHVCRRKLWLFANGINMEHTSTLVAEGKLIGESTYPQRPEKYTEMDISGSKIDFYDARNKVIHEIKKSDSMEPAHEWQVKYYILLLERHGIENVTGVLEYPKLRQTKEVRLEKEDRRYLEDIILEIEALVNRELCPPRLNDKLCKKCAYFDFCYSGD